MWYRFALCIDILSGRFHHKFALCIKIWSERFHHKFALCIDISSGRFHCKFALCIKIWSSRFHRKFALCIKIWSGRFHHKFALCITIWSGRFHHQCILCINIWSGRFHHKFASCIKNWSGLGFMWCRPPQAMCLICKPVPMAPVNLSHLTGRNSMAPRPSYSVLPLGFTHQNTQAKSTVSSVIFYTYWCRLQVSLALFWYFMKYNF